MPKKVSVELEWMWRVGAWAGSGGSGGRGAWFACRFGSVLLGGHKGREGQMIHLTSCNALQK